MQAMFLCSKVEHERGTESGVLPLKTGPGRSTLTGIPEEESDKRYMYVTFYAV